MKKEIVMIHGWRTRSYNSNLDCKTIIEGVAWSQRQELINLLGKKYSIHFYNLPGFCCVNEPQKQAFDLTDFSDNFAKWLKEK